MLGAIKYDEYAYSVSSIPILMTGAVLMMAKDDIFILI